ncbi:hypothetical protein ACWD0A_09895 [Streptomyces sp. NPDC002867]
MRKAVSGAVILAAAAELMLLATPARAVDGTSCTGWRAFDSSLPGVTVNMCVSERTEAATQKKGGHVHIYNGGTRNVFLGSRTVLLNPFGGDANCADVTLVPGATRTCASFEMNDTNADLNSERAVASIQYWNPSFGSWQWKAVVSPWTF